MIVRKPETTRMFQQQRKNRELVFQLSEESRPRLTSDPLPLNDPCAFPGDQLEFDVAFLEGILEQDPYHEEALLFLGNAYTRLGRHADGLRIDLRLVRLLPGNPTCLYNLACSYSLLERLDEAIEALQQATQSGYADVEHMLQDDDLANLRADERFGAIVKAMQTP